MKSVRSFLLGTAAVFATGGTALAADMAEPAAAGVAREAFEPPPPVASCKDKKGYYIVPNTETCLKITGLIRAQIYVHEDNVAADSWTSDGFDSIKSTVQTNDSWSMGTAGRLGADVVRQTDYGTLRGNVVIEAGRKLDGDPNQVRLRYGFIEWAGFTAGHTDTFFNAGNGALGGFGGAIGDYDGRRSLLGYKADFSKQISAAISLEDHDDRDDGPDSESSGIILAPAGAGLVRNDGTILPDIVANIQGSFDWGSLFVSGAVAHNRFIAATAGGTRLNDTGWAVGAGAQFNLDMLAKGDGLQAKFGYSDGTANFIEAPGDAAILDVIGADWGVLATTAWTAQSSFQHNWSASWNSTVYGGYFSADRHPGSEDVLIALTDDKATSAWNIGGNLVWSPVAELTIGAEFFYGSVTRDDTSQTVSYTNDAFGSVFRMQRQF